MNLIAFNVNDKVRLRLTGYGRAIETAFLQQFAGRLVNCTEEMRFIQHHRKKVDEFGWTEWQLWEVMQIFGPHLNMGNPVFPFELTILMEVSGEFVAATNPFFFPQKAAEHKKAARGSKAVGSSSEKGRRQREAETLTVRGYKKQPSRKGPKPPF